MKSVKPKRNIRDTVFTDLFGIKKYALALYKSLCSNDDDVTENDVKIVTLRAVIVSGIYNDLALLIRGKLLFLMEDQTNWSDNIVVRLFLYLAEIYKAILKDKDLYGSKLVELPVSDLYVLYTGSKKIKEKELSLKNIFFKGKGSIDLTVKVITDINEDSVLKEYIKFCKKITNAKKGNYDMDSLEKVIDDCIKHDILKEYLSERRTEVMSIMTMLYDQDTITRNHENALVMDATEKGIKQGRAEGIEIGHQKGRLSMLVDLVKQNILDAKKAAMMLGMPVSEFNALLKQ